MITEIKVCYECGGVIPSLDSNLTDTQTDRNGIEFVIENLIIECSKGHKNQVCVTHD